MEGSKPKATYPDAVLFLLNSLSSVYIVICMVLSQFPFMWGIVGKFYNNIIILNLLIEWKLEAEPFGRKMCLLK